MKRITLFALVLALLVLPLVSVGSGREFAADILVYVILAVALYVQIGLVGMVNFGFSAFFGLGAYAGALAMMRLTPSLLPSLAVAVLVVMVVALLFGALAIRTRETAFTILTLTFSQLLYVLAVADDKVTGGVNGLTGVPRPRLPAWIADATGLTFDSDTGFYYLALACAAIVVFGVHVLQRSRLGAVFAGIRENEERMAVLGYAVSRYKLAAFVISAGLGGLAGYLNAALLGYVGPGSLFWTLSGEAILMVSLGGASTLVGPIIGAAAFIGLSHFAVGVTDHWRLFVGMAFIGIMLFAPRGLVPIVRDKLARLNAGSESSPSPNHLPLSSGNLVSVKTQPSHKEVA